VEAYWAARSGPSRSKAVSDVNSALLADRPLADERRTD